LNDGDEVLVVCDFDSVVCAQSDDEILVFVELNFSNADLVVFLDVSDFTAVVFVLLHYVEEPAAGVADDQVVLVRVDELEAREPMRVYVPGLHGLGPVAEVERQNQFEVGVDQEVFVGVVFENADCPVGRTSHDHAVALVKGHVDHTLAVAAQGLQTALGPVHDLLVVILQTLDLECAVFASSEQLALQQIS